MWNLLKKDDNERIIKQQSKLTFKVTQKSYKIYDSYSFERNEVLWDRPIYLGFVVRKLGKFLMYETSYDTSLPCFGEQNKQIHYLDTDGFVLGVNTNDIIRNLKNFDDILDFSKLTENLELFRNKNERVSCIFKRQTP